MMMILGALEIMLCVYAVVFEDVISESLTDWDTPLLTSEEAIVEMNSFGCESQGTSLTRSRPTDC